MTDSANTNPDSAASDASQPVATSAGASSWPEPSAQPGAASAAAERPELIVSAAFAGGLLLATILKRLAR